MQNIALVVAVLVFSGGFGPVAQGSPIATEEVRPAATPSGSPAVPPPPRAFVPDPAERIPSEPAALAETLDRVIRALRPAIDGWVEAGSPGALPVPENVELLALSQQRIYRTLGRDPKLADRAIARLPRSLRDEARANVSAAAELFSLSGPISGPSPFRTGPPLPAGVLLRYYRQAERRFGVAWEVLAAVNRVETAFGRIRSASYAGAQGPMQFIPSTWAAYGMGGDVRDPRDAIMGAANYLRASGAPGDHRGALYAYNPSWAYVNAVWAYARQMMRDPRDYYAYYSWQAFVLTTRGDRRLTGPGLPGPH